MRPSRLFATVCTVAGVGLVSGSAAQVAALDGDLERAAKRQNAPGHQLGGTEEAGRRHEVRCRFKDRDKRPDASVS
jgi:hypothetical protein